MHSYKPKPNLQKIKEANNQMLHQTLVNGMKPKWYVVIHFNDGASSKKQQLRRINEEAVEADCEKIRDALYSELYGSKWKKKARRARSQFAIEYGKSQIKPHLNIILEQLPAPFDDYKSTTILFNYILPARVRCLWRKSADVQPVDFSTAYKLNRYCSKESDDTNSTIIYTQSDF